MPASHLGGPSQVGLRYAYGGWEANWCEQLGRRMEPYLLRARRAMQCDSSMRMPAGACEEDSAPSTPMEGQETASDPKANDLSASSSSFEALCDNLLRSVLSWLEPQELMSTASTTKRWAKAAACAELWQRRASPGMLGVARALAASAQQQEKQAHVGLHQLGQPQSGPVSRPLTSLRLLTHVYSSNLLLNASFLERINDKGSLWVSSRQSPLRDSRRICPCSEIRLAPP